jgi:glycosyltransferase involved in cell wall biosynthesis
MQVVLSLNPGGTERLVIDIIRHLHPGIPMSVCCLDEPGSWAREVEALGVQVEALHRPPGFHPSVGLRLGRVAAQHGATVLHCHHYSPFVYGSVAKLRHPGLRVLYTEHGRLSDTAPSVKRRVANAVLATLPSGVFTVSEELKAHIVAEGFSPSSVRPIYNGVSIRPLPSLSDRAERRSRLGVTPETLVIGTIARLDPVKDLSTLVSAMPAILAKHPARLVIIGDGPERSALEQVAAEAGVSDAVTFLGHQEGAADWLGALDVYVNCSISEGVSLTILEAMAAGLPVVATRVGGTPEVVDEHSALLVSSRQPGALAAAVLLIASDDVRRKRMGAAARTRAEALFSIEEMVRQYRDVYLGA